MDRWFGIAAALLGGLGVAAGAFGAHALRDQLPERLMQAWETGAQYQLWHALALLLAWRVLLAAPSGGGTAARVASWSFLIGVVVFSGSLYLLATTGRSAIGAITPVGGVALLVGWAALVVALWPSA